MSLHSWLDSLSKSVDDAGNKTTAPLTDFTKSITDLFGGISSGIKGIGDALPTVKTDVSFDYQNLILPVLILLGLYYFVVKK